MFTGVWLLTFTIRTFEINLFLVYFIIFGPTISLMWGFKFCNLIFTSLLLLMVHWHLEIACSSNLDKACTGSLWKCKTVFILRDGFEIITQSANNWISRILNPNIVDILHLSLEFERDYVFFDPELHAHTKCKYGRLPERLSMESNFANNSSWLA